MDLFIIELSHAEKIFLMQASVFQKRIMLKLEHSQSMQSSVKLTKSHATQKSRESGAPLYSASLVFILSFSLPHCCLHREWKHLY